MEYQRATPKFRAPGQVAKLLAWFVDEVGGLFQETLVGVYVRGSLATGDFDPDTSDIDTLVVIDREVDTGTFARIKEMHRQLVGRCPRYGPWLETAYVHRAALRNFKPGELHPTLVRRKPFDWYPHGAQWLLDYTITRECGASLYGPPFSSLVGSIQPSKLKAIIRTRLSEWEEWASDSGNPDWTLPNSHKSYVVATMCRALYALECDVLASKERSARWGMEAFPEPWKTTVKRSRIWLHESQTDLTLIPEVQRFVSWASMRGQLSASNAVDEL